MIAQRYKWLLSLGVLPRMMNEAIALYGVTEIPGADSNKLIIEWANEVGLSQQYRDDDTPWCGLFMAVVVKRSGREPVAKPLWARSWAKWGIKADEPGLGDILVFKRGAGGHVGLYAGEDSFAYHVLGGNQANMVNITRVAKSRLIAARRPEYKNKPETAMPYLLSADGVLSTVEA